MIGVGRTVLLEGEAAARHLTMARGLLQVARLSSQFPKPDAIDFFLSLLTAGFRLDTHSGFPLMEELVQLRADQQLAAEFLRQQTRATQPKRAHYRRLIGAELPPVSDLRARVMEREGRRVRLQVIRDFVDLGSGCFVRLTLELVQTGRRHILVSRDNLAQVSEAFQRAAEQCASHDVEIALRTLSDLEGLEIEEVTRGQLGPLQGRGLPAPELIQEALAEIPEASVLHLTLQRAGHNVPEDRCVDPFTTLFRSGLRAPALRAAEERRHLLGYRVSKERRLICTPNAEAALAASLRNAGYPLVVRSR